MRPPKAGRDNTNQVGLVLSTLEDLGHALILVVGAEFVLQSGFAGAVQDTLGTVTILRLEHVHRRLGQLPRNRDLPVSHEDFPAVQHIAEGNAAVILPLLQDLEVVDEDDEVIRATLVEDLGNRIVGTRHDDGSVDW